MKNKSYFIFSMPLMGILTIIFAISIAIATFIERDYGTAGARYAVFNAKWFEALLLLGIINLTGNILINRLYRKSKFTIFVFHFAFIIILLGAAITRYFGYEGVMHIRENGSSAEMQTDGMFIHVEVGKGSQKKYLAKKVLFSKLSERSFKSKIKHFDEKIKIQSVAFIPHAHEEIIETDKGGAAIKVVYSGFNGRQETYLKKGGVKILDGIPLAFETEKMVEGVNIYRKDGVLHFSAPVDVKKMIMSTTAVGGPEIIPAYTEAPLFLLNAYNVEGVNFVFPEFYEKATLKLVEGTNENDKDAVVLKLSSKNTEKKVTIFGREGLPSPMKDFKLGDVDIRLSYGPGKIFIPFSLKLNDFVIDRYPGSNSPASYASFLTLIDRGHGVERNIEISMNNILRYKGFRFYQSSYDEDEHGTILSVNKDLAGSIVSYAGYILLALGMFLSVLNKKSRFRKLSASVKTILLIFSFSFISNFHLNAQSNHHHHHNDDGEQIILRSHARFMDDLIIQDDKGRMKPFHTHASEILRKLYRNDSYNGLHANQVVLGIMINPFYWQNQPIIKVSHDSVRHILGIDGKYAAFIDFFDLTKTSEEYKLSGMVDKAFHKQPSKRGKLDNELLKVDERLNIFYMVRMALMFKTVPIPGSSNNKWMAYPNIPDSLMIMDSIHLRSLVPLYFEKVDNAISSGDWEAANEMGELLKHFQHSFGGQVMPDDDKVKKEILYNEIDIFARLSKYYAYIGLILLALLFIAEIYPKYSFRKVHTVFSIAVIVLFSMQTTGLALRWYVSGHAPWSNGYESLIYIAWATVLAGVIFSRKSFFTLAATSILSSVILMVAHLSWMDPEITNLVPVLNSYWLTIHVSIITASYGFLGLAALLSAVNLLLMLFKTPLNAQRIDGTIGTLSVISEMTIIIGLYMISIGTFLGGVWANESWGRYWGWDPKETWALVTILVYAFIAHMRLIPGFKSNFALSFMSLTFGYGSVIMTYFGVNYYLAGLHSYAKGDGVPLPPWVLVTVIIVLVISLLAWINNNRVSRAVSSE